MTRKIKPKIQSIDTKDTLKTGPASCSYGCILKLFRLTKKLNVNRIYSVICLRTENEISTKIYINAVSSKARTYIFDENLC